MSLDLVKRVTVHYKASPLMDGEGFLFEVDQADLPYEIFGKDCVEIARTVSPGAIPYRLRDGEIVTVDVRRELADVLRTVSPTLGEDGLIGFGKDLFPRITGVAVKDSDVAHRVGELFEDRGYEIIKAYS
jgi:hypothetical protein